MLLRALCSNIKTYKSLDLSTNCPKLVAGHPCSYCYVESARKKGVMAKRIEDKCEYNNDILRLRQSTVDKLNECGGLRLFSFGDYLPWMDDQLEIIVEDAKQRNLKLKAITKVPQFVEKFNQKIDIINVSIDNLDEGMQWPVAIDLAEEYDNVRVRAAIMSYEDLEVLNWVNIITLNHAHNGYHLFSKRELTLIAERFPNKLCCTTGRCITCPIKCGLIERR